MSEHVQVSASDGIGAIRIARPEKKNALTTAMYDSLIAALANFDADDTNRLVTLRGGDDFTAGNDLRDFLAHQFDFESAPPIRFLRALRRFSKPIVVAVRGAAIGIGTTMLLHCDCVLASDTATFSLPFAKLGLVPEGASTLLLPMSAGNARASWYLMTGDTFNAQTAADMGLVANVVADSELDAAADATATRLAQLPTGALRETKRLLHHPFDAGVDEAMRRETESFLERLQTQEFRDAAMRLLS